MPRLSSRFPFLWYKFFGREYFTEPPERAAATSANRVNGMTQQTTQDYLQLIAQATTIFQQSYPGAVTFSATGLPDSGVAKTTNDLTTWSFVAKTQDGAAELTYTNGAFGKPVLAEVPIGLKFNQLPQGTIQLPQAIRILNDNGYTNGFSSVSLGTPVYLQPQPMFWFCVGRQTQGVSASTGDFSHDLFLCGGRQFEVPRQA
jgi:hypothetical protein